MSKMKPTSPEKSLEYYFSLTYPYELVRDEDGSFMASHPGLIGCLAQGDTADEATGALDLARRAWIEVRFEEGLPIPEPLEARVLRSIERLEASLTSRDIPIELGELSVTMPVAQKRSRASGRKKSNH